MAYKEVLRVEISEVIRRWQAGNSRRHIASGTGLSKDTVGKYIAAAEALGIARDGPGPGEEQLSRLAAISRSGPRQVAAPTWSTLPPPFTLKISLHKSGKQHIAFTSESKHQTTAGNRFWDQWWEPDHYRGP